MYGLVGIGCLGVECSFDVVLIKCSLKLLTVSLNVRWVDAFGLLRFFFRVLSWLFFLLLCFLTVLWMNSFG